MKNNHTFFGFASLGVVGDVEVKGPLFTEGVFVGEKYLVILLGVVGVGVASLSSSEGED